MKPLGTVIDLQQDLFSFTDLVEKRRVQVALSCTKAKKTLNDVKMASTLHQVNMFRPIPVQDGPMIGQSLFPGLDHLSPTAQEVVDKFRNNFVGKTSNRMKTRVQLKAKKPKVERAFPEGADINPEL